MNRGVPLTPTTVPPPPPAWLSPRQLEILAAYVRHGSFKAAAHELGVSPHHVKRTVGDEIHTRLGVHTTVQAVWACRRLLEPLVMA